MKKTHVTPAGQAIWPKLSQPETKFDADGVYETSLRLDAETGQKFLSMLEEKLEEHHAEENKRQGEQVKKGSISYKNVEVDGVATGELDFKFKMKALAGKKGQQWSQRPKLVDAKGTPIDPDKVSVGSGSKIKISYSIYPYYSAMVGAGLSLQLRAVQIIDLVEYAGSDGKSLGFTEEEGFEFTKEAEDDTFADADFS